MLKSNHSIAIVRSSNKELSSMGQNSADAVKDVLAKHYKRVNIFIIDTSSDLQALVNIRPDLVFLGLEFIPSNPALGVDDPNKLWLADYLDQNNIAHTGSSYQAYELGRDKRLAKQRVLDANLMTAAFFVLKRGQIIKEDEVSLNYPLFVKPLSRGGGLGIDLQSVVHDYKQLIAKTTSIATEFHSDSLIEEYLDGREFSVAVLKDGTEPDAGYLVMPIELIAPLDSSGVRILSSAVKSADAEVAVAVNDRILKSQLSELALNVFNVLGASDYGRVDIRLDRSGVAHFLEVNLIPSLISGYGSFPKACVLNINLKYEPMILRIAKLGLARRSYVRLAHTDHLRLSAAVANPAVY